MILHRLANHALEVHPRSYYLAWDSSPQYGRDVMGVLMFSVEVQILPKLFVKLQKLKRLWEAPIEGGDLDLAQFTEERLQEELRLIASIELGVAEHRPPLVNLGFGASSFAQKLRTLRHAIRLEHFRGAGLKTVISALISLDARLRRGVVDHVDEAGVLSRAPPVLHADATLQGREIERCSRAARTIASRELGAMS